MKVTQADLEMLPGWVQAGENTARLLEWMLGAEPVWDLPGYALVKVKQGNFYFLYLAKKDGGQCLKTEGCLEFGGLFCTGSYGLRDVQEPLRKALGMPEGMGFPSKEDAAHELEQKVSGQISDILENHWDEVLAEGKYEARQLIPPLKREEVRRMAEESYLDGKSASEVAFRPQVSLGKKLSDACYLMYLDHGERAVQAMAMQWVKRQVPYLSRQRILYGCIREEMQEIPPHGRLEKVRQMREALAGLEDGTVQVEARRKGKTASIRMQASQLMGRQGRYPLNSLAPRERMQIEKAFGKKAGDLQAEEIIKVTQSRRLLYTADMAQDAA